WVELKRAVEQLQRFPQAATEAALLAARRHAVRREFGDARKLLEETVARDPRLLEPRLLLGQVLLDEGKDLAAAEEAPGSVLELAPERAECWRDLVLLLRRQGRLAEALAACRTARPHCRGDTELLLQQGMLLHELGDRDEAEACLLAVIEALMGAPPGGE